VIVKKVPPSTLAAPKSLAANVRDLADYIAGPSSGDPGEKVEHRGALNFFAGDHDGQVQEMTDLAEVARRDAKPIQHWILSWREGEQPTAAQADEAVKMFLGEMGMSDHLAIYALHSDTHNWHLHVALNRVHPETAKLITANKGYDHRVAHLAIARIELRQRWEPEANALYTPDARGELKLVERPETERQPGARALAFEERVGARSAERIAIEEVAPTIRRAATWRELHEALGKAGMRYEKKGSGALLWIGDQPVKASVAGRDCSMSALRKRLGDFEPAPTLPPPQKKATSPRPLDPAAPLLTSYLEQRRKHSAQRAEEDPGASRQRDEWHQLADRHRKERADMFRGSWKGKGDALNALRSLTAARQAQEKADLHDRHKRERLALRRDRGRFPSYEEWVARFDRDAADKWRHRTRRPATIEGASFDHPTLHDIRAVRAVLDGGKVHYHLAGSRGAPAFTDRGKAIDIHDGRNREAVLAALQLSAQKWGTFTIRGDERFKRTCVELAAEHGFKISNPDLQQALTAERDRLRAQKTSDAPPRTNDRRPTSMAPVHIYRRHLHAITQEQPARRADPSRLDGEVAVRMAVTGHSREAIARAIKEGARAERPNEQREWDTYARRAADFAFSPPGRDIQQRLAGQRQTFVRLEGREAEIELLRKLGGPLRHL
jgi:hypothetical protein